MRWVHAVAGSESSSIIPASQAAQLPPSAPSQAVPGRAQHSAAEVKVALKQPHGIIDPSVQTVLHPVPWARKPSVAQVPKVPWPPGAVTPSQW